MPTIAKMPKGTPWIVFMRDAYLHGMPKGVAFQRWQAIEPVMVPSSRDVWKTQSDASVRTGAAKLTDALQRAARDWEAIRAEVREERAIQGLAEVPTLDTASRRALAGLGRPAITPAREP